MHRSTTLLAAFLFVAACGGSAPAPQTPVDSVPPVTDAPVDPPMPPAERSCGGMVAGQGACGENEFCDYARDAICGAADATGVCRLRPEMCPEVHMPVCGCDDRTYSNDCTAAAAGVAVAADGECPQRYAQVGETCGTRGALPCAEGLFCNFPSTADCGRSDAPGTCAERPTSCDTRVRRVCGCDHTTYPNACAANLAGVSVETTRACTTR